jgi:cell division protein FtsB
MKQQVNLLAPMFRKQRALFSAQICAAILVLFALALTLVYGAFSWRGAALAAEEARLEGQRAAATSRLNELAAQVQSKGQNHELDAQVQALTAERDRKQQAFAALSRKELGNTEGFSPQFTGLARQRVNGLWLTHIEVAASGAQMSLAGVTLSEELIPKYLQKLGSEAVFAGMAFQEASLARRNDGGNQLQFELRTHGGGRAGGAP